MREKGDGLVECEKFGLCSRKALQHRAPVSPATVVVRMQVDPSHLISSGAAVVFCRRCGAYAEARSVGL